MTAEDMNVERKEIEQANVHVCYRTDEVCLNCRRFDENHQGGYCDYHRVDTSPTNSCSDFWAKHACYRTDKVCQDCRKFDPNYHGGYCDYHKVDTSSTNSCSDFWAK